LIPIKDNIPTDRFPLVTVALILANIVVYVLASSHGGSLISGPDTHELVKYGVSPYSITHPTGRTWGTVFTSMFMHASILHLAGNMLFLWIFGNNVEDSMGPVRFLLFYVAGGLAALALQVAVEPNSLATTVGASGAIAAVLGGYIVLYPRARVLTLVLIILFFTVIELPAMVMLGLWFAEQAVFGAVGLTDPAGGGGAVAWFAHVGGFAFGLLAIRALATRRKPTPPTAAAYR
jgi:membrane associated rhomboid family serine protease